jgi:RNA polymerase sigma-70 factor (ECF subfamily)
VTTTQEEMERVGQRRPMSGDDASLASRARTGDRGAFTALLRRHDPTMRRLAFRMLADATAMDDVLQEAYVKAYTALPSYRDDARFSTWLYRITYNACIDEIRRRRRRPAPTDEPFDVPSPVAGPERVVTAAESLRRTLASLPADQRATVVLVDGEGFDHTAAAQILGVAPGTVASRLSRARSALRRSTEEIDR